MEICTSINDRFNEVFKKLKKDGLIKNKTSLANDIGTYNHIISAIMKGKRSITLVQLKKLCEKFNVNANYVLGLSDKIYKPKPLIIELTERSMDAIKKLEVLSKDINLFVENHKQ
jgi:hypothetical protein